MKMDSNSETSMNIDKLKQEENHMCTICQKVFKQKNNLDRHLLTHSGQKPFACSTCNKQFTQKISLTAHFFLHSGEKPYECPTCLKRFTLKNILKVHLKTHSGKSSSFTCSICSKQFASRTSLKRHLLIHSGEKPYKCPTCQKCFNRKGNLDDHISIHSGIKSFVCSKCSKQFRLKSNFRKHLRIHLKKKHNKNEFTESKQHTQQNSLLIVKSSLARKLSTPGRYLGINKKETISLNKKKVNSNNATTREEVENQPDTNKHVCPQCQKSFTQKHNLKIHLMTHSADKPFVCPTCSKPFSYKRSFKTHMLFHSQVKPHECQKSHTCNSCQKVFYYKSDLIKHARVHSGMKPYACDVCKKEFVRKHHLVDHLRIHSDVKPYACDICKKGFAQKINLIRHLRLHSGEKPFICSTCNKTFPQKEHLKKHQRIHLNKQQRKYSLTKKTSSLKSKDYLRNNELLKRHGCLKNIEIVCHKLTDDEIQQYSSNASEGNVKKEFGYDLQLQPNKSKLWFEVPIIKQELMTEEDLETPSCSYYSKRNMSLVLKRVNESCGMDFVWDSVDIHIYSVSFTENVKKEIENGLQRIKSELSDEPIPSTSYQNVLIKDEPNESADVTCINQFDDSIVKEETEII